MSREDVINGILSLVACQDADEIWWGHDTDIGTGAEIVAEGLAILDKLDAEPKQCYWAVDLAKFKCPLHGGAIGECPLPGVAATLGENR